MKQFNMIFSGILAVTSFYVVLSQPIQHPTMKQGLSFSQELACGCGGGGGGQKTEEVPKDKLC